MNLTPISYNKTTFLSSTYKKKYIEKQLHDL